MSEDSHDKQIAVVGKGYSYLFASFLTLFITLQSLNFSLENTDEKLQIKLSIREIPIHVFIPSISIIAVVLGLNTDAIALSVGKFLNQENK